jgi:Flp pilus assembly protein protease CpaA
MMNDKNKFYFSQDLIGFTCLVFLKSNRSKFQIDMEKQSQTLYTCMMMIFFQCMLVWCLANEMLVDLSKYEVPNGMKFELFLCKFIVTIAMHLNILPVLSSGFGIMKYVANHPGNFDFYWICYTLGFIQLAFSMLFEVLNVIQLFYKGSVYYSLGCYFSMSILIYLQKMYYSTKIAGNRHEVLQAMYLEENTPQVVWRDSKNTWASRSFVNKLMRLNYKVLYGFYVSFIYYFTPFLFLCMMQFINEDAD